MVRRNFGKALQVCRLLGKLLRREGLYLRVSEMFYRAVVQAVLLCREDTWVLSAVMLRKLEGLLVIFLRQVTVKKSKRQK